MRRVFRIYPLYYFSLLAVAALIFLYPRTGFPTFGGSDGAEFVLAADHGDFRQWIQQVFLATPGFDFYFLNPPSWTLAIEMRMAILFPMLSVVISRLSFLNGAIFILATLTCSAVVLSENLPELGIAAAFPLFALGAFFAQHRSAVSKLSLRARHLAGIAGISLILYSFRAAYPSWAKTGWFACGFGSLGFLLVGLRSTALNSFLSHRRLKFVGDLSYGIYILHFPMLLWLSTAGLNSSRPMGLLLFVVGFVLTIVVAFFAHRCIEQPFIRIGRALSKRLNGTNGSISPNVVTVRPRFND
jgi:peptidoglycan/LPS O-acetylase OafA/YrhL